MANMVGEQPHIYYVEWTSWCHELDLNFRKRKEKLLDAAKEVREHQGLLCESSDRVNHHMGSLRDVQAAAKSILPY